MSAPSKGHVAVLHRGFCNMCTCPKCNYFGTPAPIRKDFFTIRILRNPMIRFLLKSSKSFHSYRHKRKQAVASTSNLLWEKLTNWNLSSFSFNACGLGYDWYTEVSSMLLAREKVGTATFAHALFTVAHSFRHSLGPDIFGLL